MRLTRLYSHSRLSSFENCPRQYHYRYVQRLPVESESIEAFLGKRVHEILERLHRFVGEERVPPLPAVLHRYRAEWDRLYDADRIRIVRSEDSVDFYRELGERCLGNYYRRHYPFDADETLGLEASVSFELDGGSVRIRGVIDRLVRAPDGAVEIHDYKTGRRVPRQKALDEDRQLALYQMGVRKRYPDAEIRLVWHYLLSDQVRVSRRTPEKLETLRARTLELIERIEAEQEFAPRPGPLCAWCEFRSLCPASGERPRPGAPAEPAAPESYTQGQLPLL